MTTLTSAKHGTHWQAWRRVTQLRRTHGNTRVAYAILRRLLSRAPWRFVVQTCAVDLWRLPLAPRPPGTPGTNLFTVRVADDQEVELLVEYFGSRQRVMSRLHRGHQCIVAMSGASIAAAVWCANGPGRFGEDWNDLRCSFRFPRGTAWAYDGKGTRMGAWGTMMKRLPEIMLERNIQEIATAIDGDNWKSFDAHHSLGYQRSGMLLHIRIAGCSLRFFKPPGQRWRRSPASIGSLGVCTENKTDQEA